MARNRTAKRINNIVYIEINNCKLNRTETVLVDVDIYEKVKAFPMWLDFRKNTAYVRVILPSGKFTRLHNIVMGKAPQDKPLIDHINCDGLDNRRCNLRFVNHSQNGKNRRIRTNPYTATTYQKQLRFQFNQSL